MLFSISTWLNIIMVFFMALLQLFLTFGMPLGEYALGGTHRILPPKKRVLSGFVFCSFFIAGLSYLQKSGIITTILNATFVNIYLVIYTLFLACAIFFNGFITKSKKEKYYMTPCTIVGFISSVFFLINS